MIDEPIKQGWEWAFTQGILGITTAGLLTALVWMYRAREKDRVMYEARDDARDKAHKIEIAEQVKLNMELQEGWRNDIRQFSRESAENNRLLSIAGKGFNREPS